VNRKVTVLLAVLGLASAAAVGRAALNRFATGPRGVPIFTVVPAPFSRVVSAEGTLRPVKASPVTAPGEGRSLLIAWMADDGAAVKKGDLVIRFDQSDAIRALADGKDDERIAHARIDKEKRAIDGAVADRVRAAALTKVEIDHAHRLGKKDPRFFPRTEVIESEIDENLLATRLSETEAAQIAEGRLGKSRVDLLVVDRQKAETQRHEAARTLASLEVRAPHDGTFVVQRMGWAQRMLQTGDRAYPGMRVAEVATTERMEADVMVLEADAGGLAAGKTASVTLEAQPDVAYPAKVKKVEPFPKTRHPEVPTQYFGATLAITGSTAGLKPGQRLRATIVLDEMARALVVPRQAVVNRNNGSYVQRQGQGGRFEDVLVELGAGTIGRVVVRSGLSPGDVIALRDTARSADEMLQAPRAGSAGMTGTTAGSPSRSRGRQ
jgi:HlyD family secretion protein